MSQHQGFDPLATFMDAQHDFQHEIPQECDCGHALKSILTFDGGGMRGYASLVILETLMRMCGDLERQEDAKWYGIGNADQGIPIPCTYFDYIFGTSTGGLIAIMLARLRMSASSALQAYGELGNKIFSHKRRLGMAYDRYDHQNLENAVKEVIDRYCRDQKRKRNAGYILRDPEHNADREFCKTGVYSMRRDVSKGDQIYLFRSYTRNAASLFAAEATEMVSRRNISDDSHLRFIWQAARATAAAPSYFKPIKIANDLYFDGGIRVNNPSAEALRETQDIHRLDYCTRDCHTVNGRHQHSPCRAPCGGVGAVVSIGTGMRAPRSMLADGNFIRKTFRITKSALSELTETETDHIYTKGKASDTGIHYSRFNVETGLEGFRLDACKIVDDRNIFLDQIRDRTMEWINSNDAVQASLDECARRLVALRRSRCAPAHGRRFRGYCQEGRLSEQVRDQTQVDHDIIGPSLRNANGEPRSPNGPRSPGVASPTSPSYGGPRSPWSGPVTHETWRTGSSASPMTATSQRAPWHGRHAFGGGSATRPHEMAANTDPQELDDAIRPAND